MRSRLLPFVILALCGCTSIEVVDLGPAADDLVLDPHPRRSIFRVRWSDEATVTLEGRPIGRGGFAAEVDGKPADGFNVLTPTTGRDGRVWLTLPHELPGGRHGIRLAVREPHAAEFRVVAATTQSWDWVDWSVASPDGRRLVTWSTDGPLTVLERRGPRLVVTANLGAPFFKCFPRFDPTGRRIAARLVAGDREAVFVDGEIGQAFDRVGEPRFDPKGRHHAHMGRRHGKAHLVVDGTILAGYDRLRLADGRHDGEIAHGVAVVGGKRRRIAVLIR